jgi:hypothetical protein
MKAAPVDHDEWLSDLTGEAEPDYSEEEYMEEEDHAPDGPLRLE